MKRRIVVPPEKRPVAPAAAADPQPRERRKLGLKYGGDAPAGEHVS